MGSRARWEVNLTGLGLIAALASVGCVQPNYRRQAPSPCTTPVSPIRNLALLTVINVSYTYTPKDEEGGRSQHRGEILDELNRLGQEDGNTFAEPNGQQTNFYLNYSLSNDGQDHFTGNLELSGWGQGHINTFNRYQYSYASAAKLLTDLTDDAYTFVHLGWHDARPTCPQS
jgi:hypothetical protein